MEEIEKAETKNILTEFPEVKAKIAELHRNKRTRPHGMRYEEMAIALPKEWDDFVEYAAEDLKLDEENEKKLEGLVQKLLDEELTTDDEQELISFMTRYEATEHPRHGQTNGV